MLLDLPGRAGRPASPADARRTGAGRGAGTLLRMRVGSLDWTAGVLAGLGCEFTVRGPDELRASVASARRPPRGLRLDVRLRPAGRAGGPSPPGRAAGSSKREADARHARLPCLTRVHDAHARCAAATRRARPAPRGRRACRAPGVSPSSSRPTPCTERSCVNPSTSRSRHEQAASGHEHEARGAAAVAGARDDPVPSHRQFRRDADAPHDARAQFVQLSADAPADDGAVADLAGRRLAVCSANVRSSPPATSAGSGSEMLIESETSDRRQAASALR